MPNSKSAALRAPEARVRLWAVCHKQGGRPAVYHRREDAEAHTADYKPGMVRIVELGEVQRDDAPKDRIRWECARCGHEHRWKWPAGEAFAGPITMVCDRCEGETATELVNTAPGKWRDVARHPRAA